MYINTLSLAEGTANHTRLAPKFKFTLTLHQAAQNSFKNITAHYTCIY